MPLGPKMALPRGHVYYISLYREKHDIWFIASPSGPLPSLLKLCPWGQNGPAPGLPGTWSAFYRYLYVSFKQNSGECFRATWPSRFYNGFDQYLEWIYFMGYIGTALNVADVNMCHF